MEICWSTRAARPGPWCLVRSSRAHTRRSETGIGKWLHSGRRSSTSPVNAVETQSISYPGSASRCCGHPGRDADAFLCRRGEHLVVDVRSRSASPGSSPRQPQEGQRHPRKCRPVSCCPDGKVTFLLIILGRVPGCGIEGRPHLARGCRWRSSSGKGVVLEWGRLPALQRGTFESCSSGSEQREGAGQRGAGEPDHVKYHCPCLSA